MHRRGKLGEKLGLDISSVLVRRVLHHETSDRRVHAGEATPVGVGSRWGEGRNVRHRRRKNGFARRYESKYIQDPTTRIPPDGITGARGWGIRERVGFHSTHRV